MTAWRFLPGGLRRMTKNRNRWSGLWRTGYWTPRDKRSWPPDAGNCRCWPPAQAMISALDGRRPMRIIPGEDSFQMIKGMGIVVEVRLGQQNLRNLVVRKRIGEGVLGKSDPVPAATPIPDDCRWQCLLGQGSHECRHNAGYNGPRNVPEYISIPAGFRLQ